MLEDACGERETVQCVVSDVDLHSVQRGLHTGLARLSGLCLAQDKR